MSWRCEDCRSLNDDNAMECTCGCPKPDEIQGETYSDIWIIKCPECDNEIVLNDEKILPDFCDNCGNEDFDDCEPYHPFRSIVPSNASKHLSRLYLIEIASIQAPGDEFFKIPRGINAEFISQRFYIPSSGGFFGANNLPDVERYYHISSKHIEFTLDENGEWYVKDNNSTNGTAISYKRNRFHKVRACNEQIIQLADRLFVLFIEE